MSSAVAPFFELPEAKKVEHSFNSFVGFARYFDFRPSDCAFSSRDSANETSSSFFGIRSWTPLTIGDPDFPPFCAD